MRLNILIFLRFKSYLSKVSYPDGTSKYITKDDFVGVQVILLKINF